MSARRSSIQSIQTSPRWLFHRLDPRHKKEKFLALCKDIRGALEDSMCPPGDFDRRFVSADALNTVWLSRDEGRPANRLDSFHQQLTKIERDPGINEKYLRLLSILLWIFYPYEGWREFARAFPELSISDRRGWQDEQLPFPDAKPLHSLFESQIDFDAHAQNFLRSQYLFSPARISELRLSDCDAEITSLPEGTRLPFADAEKTLHHGTHRVTRRKVARGGIETLSGDPLDVVAVKTFSADQRGQFVNELRNLKQLKKASSIHPNIQSCFSAIKIGSTGHLIFEAAECNLSQILHWQEAFSATFFADIRRDLKPGFLLWEAKDLSDALHWLHRGFGTKNSPDRFKCYHLDLKPDNILVFPSSYADLPDDIWTWKIADFGGSVIKHMGNISNSESGTAASGLRLRTGIYQAPEIESAQYDPGTAADIWSFGCILLEILAFAHGGPGGVKGLERVRNSNNKPHFYDSTFTLREDVRAWVDGLDIVDAGLQGFRDLIYELLERDPEDRPNAQDLQHPLDIAWDRVRMGANDLIFPTPSEASTSEQATDIEMPTNDPPLIRMIDGSQPVCHQIKKELRKTPSKCRISTNGSHAIVQMRSERNCSAFSITPGWNDHSTQEPRNLLTEEETHKYDVEKVAVEDTFCAALIRTVGGEDFQVGHVSIFTGSADRDSQLLLCGQDRRTFHNASPGTDLSISADGDCIVHGESSLQIVLNGSNRARELPLPGALKRACFSRNGKWIYAWSRTRHNATDHYQVFQVVSDDQKPFLQIQCPFVPSPAAHSRDLIIALSDLCDENSARPLFLTIDKHGNANVLISDGHAFYVHSIQDDFSGYTGGAATEDGRSILLIHQSQAKRTPYLHLVDLHPEKIRTTDRNEPLELRYNPLQASYLRDFVANTGFSISSEESEVYAYFAVKRKNDITLKRVLVGYHEQEV